MAFSALLHLNMVADAAPSNRLFTAAIQHLISLFIAAVAVKPNGSADQPIVAGTCKFVSGVVLVDQESMPLKESKLPGRRGRVQLREEFCNPLFSLVSLS